MSRLTCIGRTRSRAAIEEFIRLQAFGERLGSVEDLSFSLMDELRGIAAAWAEATSALRLLPADEPTIADKRKLEHFEATIRTHLDRYGFRSFQPVGSGRAPGA